MFTVPPKANEGQVLTWYLGRWLPRTPAVVVTDHGALTGLSDDDHTQYHTDARGDARYAPVAHVGAGGAAHANVVAAGAAGFMTGADKTKLDSIATGAEVNVNADWNAVSGDAQILNKPTTMTPTAHASTHNAGGADALAIDAAAATGSLRTLGTAATAACAGNDSRLSNARTPTPHVLDSASHTISGKTAGQVMLATAPTTYGFTTVSGDATMSGAGALTIAASAVSLGKMANLAANSIIGNNTASPATPLALTVAQVKTLLSYTAADVSAVPTSRTVTAGTGLTGGGALSANITLAVAYGATGTTACVGNDSRLSDARAPTTHATSHKSGGSDAIKLDELAAPTDVTTLNASTTAHGLLKKLSNVATEFMDGTGNWSTPASASVAFWGRLTNATELALTGAATATIDRFHTINLTSADATITLPAASTNGGKVCGFHVLSTNTKCVTIDGNSTETIDGVASLTMHKDGTLLLYCDGSNWFSLVRELAPNVNVEASDSAGQVITANTTDIQFTTETVDTHGAWSGTVFTAPVAGVYDFCGAYYCNAAASNIVLYANGSAAEIIGHVRDNGTAWLFHGRRKLAAGDTVKFRASVSSTRDNSGLTNWLRITRIGDA